MNHQVIYFGENMPTLLDYGEIPWKLNEKYNIEFYPGFIISVLLISIENPRLKDHLEDISNGIEPISLDLEWEEEICLFQFCTSKGCLIIRHPRGPGNLIIRSFFENHSFYGKGNHNDIQKLNEKFGPDFTIDLEDIEQTRLIPNNYSTNFIKMSEQFAGKSTAVFKDKEMTFSNWEVETLSMRQVLYAAFDVVALLKCYPNFPPRTENSKPIKIKNKGPKGKKCVNFDPILRRKYPIENPNSIDNSNKLYCYILHNYKEKPNVYEIRNKIISVLNFDYDNDSLFDYVSVLQNERSHENDVLLSIYSKINEKVLNPNSLSCESVEVIPDIDPFISSLFNKNDVFYLNDIPENLLNKDLLNDFLSIFGTDFDVILFENDKYASVKPNDPYASFRLHRFLTFVSKMSIHEFPSFLPILTIYSDTEQSNNDIFNKLHIQKDEQQTIEIKDNSQASQSFKYSVTFSSNELKEKFFEKFIQSDDYGKGITVLPFISDDHFKLINSYKIILKNCQNSISDIYKTFIQFGPIFSIKKDEILNHAYIQFRTKTSAYHAVSQMNKEKQALFDDIEILKGTTITLRNIPDDLTEIELFEICKATGEILEIIFDNDMRYIKITFENHFQAVDTRDELKRSEIHGKQIQVEIQHEHQSGTPSWKIQQIMKWVKIKESDMNDSFIKASKFGKVIDMRLKEDEECTYVMFTNEKSADQMKTEMNECEDCDQLNFLLFLNKKLLSKEDKKENSSDSSSSSPAPTARYANRKVFILDPKPDLLTDEIMAEKAFEWRRLISGAHNVDSVAHVGKKRAIFYSGGKKRDQQIIELIINLGIELGDSNKWKPVALTFSSANKSLAVPPPPVKKARRWVIIDPVPISMTEKVIRKICSEFEPFDVMYQNSSIEKGEKRAVILKEPHAKFVYWKLVGMEYEGKQLNVTKIAPEYAPDPL